LNVSCSFLNVFDYFLNVICNCLNVFDYFLNVNAF
jgi:hypothetical protein